MTIHMKIYNVLFYCHLRPDTMYILTNKLLEANSFFRS